MSKFWASASDSEDDEPAQEEVESEEEKTETAASERGQQKKSAYAYDSEESDDDDGEVKRVVLSHSVKRDDELRSMIKAMKQHAKAEDFNTILTDLEKVQKFAQRWSTSRDLPWPPRLFVKALATLQDIVTAVDTKEAKEKLNAQAVKTVQVLKQRVKKYTPSFTDAIAKYRENPDKEEEESDNEENPDGEDNEEEQDNDNENEDDEVNKDSDEHKSDSSDSEGEAYPGDKPDSENRASKWKLKTPATAKPTEVSAKPTKPVKPATTDKSSTPNEQEEVSGEEAAPTVEVEEEELTQEGIVKKLAEIISSRGRRRTDVAKQEEQLKKLLTLSESNKLTLQILLALAAAQFDATPSKATHMPVPLWRRCLATVNKIVEILRADESIVLEENKHLAIDHIPDEEEDKGHKTKKVVGTLIALLERLDEQYTRSLQNLDPHNREYISRMGDEQPLLKLAKDVYDYYTRVKNTTTTAQCASIIVAHTYYRRAEEKEGIESEAAKTIQSLAAVAYQYGDERIRARTVLHQVYFFALHDRFYDARDLLLRTHLQDFISEMNLHFQILFNRAMVQLGLCAFRKGMIQEAHQCLADMYAGTPIKELLGQGLAQKNFMERDPQQEKAERKRQIPYHLHINLELIESCHLLSAMLLEVPNMAAQSHAAYHVHDPSKRKLVISRTFRRLMEHADRQPFIGPPQYVRDIVVAAARALRSGDWKRCAELVLGLKAWTILPGGTAVGDAVRTMLGRKVREAGLRAFLCAHIHEYRSITLTRLSEMFDLPLSTVHSTVCRMLSGEELRAALDQPTGTLVGNAQQPTRLQALALLLADKVATLVDNNEHTFDARTGASTAASAPSSYQTYQGTDSGYRQRGSDRREGQQQSRNYNERRERSAWQPRPQQQQQAQQSQS